MAEKPGPWDLPSPVVGYITSNGGASWDQVSDTKKLLDFFEQYPELVSFAQTDEELLADLLRRYPDVVPQYGRVWRRPPFLHDAPLSVADLPKFGLMPEPYYQPRHRQDSALLLEYIKRYGKVLWHSHYAVELDEMQLRAEGIVLGHEAQYCCFRAVYDPAAARAAKFNNWYASVSRMLYWSYTQTS